MGMIRHLYYGEPKRFEEKCVNIKCDNCFDYPTCQHMRQGDRVITYCDKPDWFERVTYAVFDIK